jgi:hypothetical protein
MIKKQSIKKCRAVDKALGFKSCGEIKTIHRFGLCKDCFYTWLYNTPEGEKYYNKSQITWKNKTDKQIKSDNRRKKIESKSISQLIQEARRPFQKLIRVRDHGKKCICCDKPLPFNIGDYDAGHFLKAELYTGLIFHPDNVHGQLTYCNKYAHGNENEYREGIKKRIGIERYNKLTSLKETLKNHKYDRYELIEMKEYYNKELNQVEKGLKNINEVDFSIGIL